MAAALRPPLSRPPFCVPAPLPGCCSGSSSSWRTCPGPPGPAPGMRRPGPAGWRDCADERVQALLVSGGGPPCSPGPGQHPVPSRGRFQAGLWSRWAHTPHRGLQPLPGSGEVGAVERITRSLTEPLTLTGTAGAPGNGRMLTVRSPVLAPAGGTGPSLTEGTFSPAPWAPHRWAVGRLGPTGLRSSPPGVQGERAPLPRRHCPGAGQVPLPG